MSENIFSPTCAARLSWLADEEGMTGAVADDDAELPPPPHALGAKAVAIIGIMRSVRMVMAGMPPAKRKANAGGGSALLQCPDVGLLGVWTDLWQCRHVRR